MYLGISRARRVSTVGSLDSLMSRLHSQSSSDGLLPRPTGQGQGMEVALKTGRATRLMRCLVQCLQVIEDHIVHLLRNSSLHGLDVFRDGPNRIEFAAGRSRRGRCIRGWRGRRGIVCSVRGDGGGARSHGLDAHGELFAVGIVRDGVGHSRAFRSTGNNTHRGYTRLASEASSSSLSHGRSRERKKSSRVVAGRRRGRNVGGGITVHGECRNAMRRSTGEFQLRSQSPSEGEAGECLEEVG